MQKPIPSLTTIAHIKSDAQIAEERAAEERARNKRLRSRVYLVVFVIAAVVTGAGVWWYGQMTRTQLEQVATEPQPAPRGPIVKPELPATDPELQKFIHPTTGEKWYPAPKKVAPLGWTQYESIDMYLQQGLSSDKAKEYMDQHMPAYKEVGTRGDAVIYYVVIPGEMGDMSYLFEKRHDGTIALIAVPQLGVSSLPQIDWLKTNVASSKVTQIDESTHYDSLTPPTKFTMENGELLVRPEYFGLGEYPYADTTTRIKLADLGSNALYRLETTYKDTGLTNIGYSIRTAFGATIAMQYMPHDESLDGYTFDNKKSMQIEDGQGKLVTDKIHAVARGCGGTTAAVTRSDKLKLADLEQVGKTSAGKPVYMVKDRDAPLVQKAYDEAQTVRENKVSLDDFISNHGMMIMKSASDELLVYVRDTYGYYGGCAKPVIYLYPAKPMSVDVAVGADVTVSDPLYIAGRGWRDVWAEPSGQLTYQGQGYSSLFWEGVGAGDYPGIISGTVVKRSEAAAMIRRQLAAQGLNQAEISDFMGYWTDKIPDKPYIRLTWLTTAQLDRLAPLSVVPRPDTVKRVFLDMGGFDRPITLPPQKLESFQRRGFTVVEWGGLVAGSKLGLQ